MDLLRRFSQVRDQTRALCAPLAVEDLVVQSMPDTSPAKWHLAHTTWFFDTFVLSSEERKGVGRPGYEHIFNSYYNTVGTAFPRARRGTLSRPTALEIWDYRERVDRAVPALFEELSGDALDSAASVLEVGLHHEQQHQELLVTDIKHALGHNPLRPPYDVALADHRADAVPMEMVSFEGGVREIGWDAEGFAFDNERPRHRVFLDEFRLASRLVTNEEFQGFMADDGYGRHELWLDAGWSWARSEGVCAPMYWEREGDAWQSYTLGGVRPLDPHAPVCHVSFFEADAFARWASKRLPTEAEWEVAAAMAGTTESRGTRLEDGALHPVGRPAQGPVRHLFGEVWEWTASAYRPYRGFSPLDGALGEYNGKFMSGQFVLRGGSCATAATHIRPTYRNFFQPEKRWQLSGFRLAD